MFTNLHPTDIETCYKAFQASVMKSIQIEEHRFGVELAIVARLGGLTTQSEPLRSMRKTGTAGLVSDRDAG
jgi:hypothetical protein